MDGETTSSEKKVFIEHLMSDSVLIIYLTGLTYFGAYLYKRSYYSFFDIPESLVVIDLEDCLRFASFTTFLVALLFNMIATLKDLYQAVASSFGEVMFKLFLSILAITVMVDYVMGGGWKVFLILASLLAFVILMIQLLKFPGINIVFMRFIRKSLKGKKTFKLTINKGLINRIGVSNVYIVLYSSLLLMAAIVGGVSKGVKEKAFWFKKGTDLALIGKYEDSLIFKIYDTKNDMWTKPVYITPKGSEEVLVIEKRKLEEM